MQKLLHAMTGVHTVC